MVLLLLFQLQEDVIICVHFALFHILEEEKSRDPKSIIKECEELIKSDKEVTLLGQNVDSYLWYVVEPKKIIKIQQLIKKKYGISLNYWMKLQKSTLF